MDGTQRRLTSFRTSRDFQRKRCHRADLLWAMEDTRDVNLIVAGDGPERSALQALAQELKLTNVRFVGHQNGSDLDDLISASRFTVLPSRAYETLGKSILESYAWERGV